MITTLECATVPQTLFYALVMCLLPVNPTVCSVIIPTLQRD